MAAAPALAAPVTVDLRIEGATRTIFEGPITTDVRQFPSNQGLKPCDNGTGAVTRGAVIAAAPVAFSANWNDGFGNPTFVVVDGENVEFEPTTGRYFAEYLNGVGVRDRRLHRSGQGRRPGPVRLLGLRGQGAQAHRAGDGQAGGRP